MGKKYYWGTLERQDGKYGYIKCDDFDESVCFPLNLFQGVQHGVQNIKVGERVKFRIYNREGGLRAEDLRLVTEEKLETGVKAKSSVIQKQYKNCIPFSQINFGLADAESEKNEMPELLLEGYYDAHKISKNLINDRKFLILGYKGSGKTAVCKHLELLLEADHSCDFTYIDLSDIQFTALPDIVDSKDERYPTAWRWIFLVYLIDAISRDKTLVKDNANISAIIETLEDVFILPSPSIKKILDHSTQMIDTKKLREYYDDMNNIDQNVNLSAMVNFLIKKIEYVCEFYAASKKFILIIDGLDEVLFNPTLDLNAISTLLSQVKKTNDTFKNYNIPFKVIALCRTDIFESLSDSNSNKMKQDNSIRLNWWINESDIKSSALIKMINYRANLSDPNVKDIFSVYFPKSVRKKEIRRFLLSFTRYTPRDFIHLFKHIQEYSKDYELINEKQIIAGIEYYANHYFLAEIRNELNGKLEPEYVELAIEILGKIKELTFTLDGLYCKDSIKNRISIEELENIFRNLFNCSAVGHLTTYNEEGKEEYERKYKYKSYHFPFDRDEKIEIHPTIKIALQGRSTNMFLHGI